MTKIPQTEKDVMNLIREIEAIRNPLSDLLTIIATAKAETVSIDVATARTHIEWLKAWASKSKGQAHAEIEKKKARETLDKLLKERKS